MTEEYYVPGNPVPAYEPPAPEPEPAQPNAPAAQDGTSDPEPDAYATQPYAPAEPAAEPDLAPDDAFAEADVPAKSGGKAKVALVGLAIVAAIGVGVGAGVYLTGDHTTAQTPAGNPEPGFVAASGPVYTVEVAAEGYDPASSTPFIITATGINASGAVVSVSHAVGAGTSAWELGEGSYSFTVIPAVNADGSTYSMPSSVTASGNVITVAATKISAADVGASYAAKIITAIESALTRADSTLPTSVLGAAKSYLPDVSTAVGPGAAGSAAGNGECEHDWELDTVDGDPIYVDGKPVYANGEPIYEYHEVCSCGIDCTAAGVSFAYHKSTHGSDNYYPSEVPVIVGYEQIVTGYEQKLVGYEQVPVGYTCEKCGDERELEE